MRYRLAHSREIKKNRWNNVCPECGRRGKFSPYIDTVTNLPIAAKECGRCCREKSCAYHMTPSEWFKEHPTENREWLPKEQYVELMKQRRREARVASLLDPLRSDASLSPLVPLKEGQFSLVCPSAMKLSESTVPTSRGTSEAEQGEAERRGYEVEEYCKRMNDLCHKSRSDQNNLARWLATRFPAEQVAEVLARYRTGSTRDGRIIYWQIDERGQVRGGKVMAYDLDGHRWKEKTPSVLRTSPPLWGEGSAMSAKPLHRGRGWGGSSPVCWVHSIRIDGIKFDEMLAPQCLFGLHLASPPALSRREGAADIADSESPLFGPTRKSVGCDEERFTSPEESRLRVLGEAAIVESEKTALIMSLVCPDRLWLATGGKANFKESMLWPLLGHEVAVYPDADALHNWAVRIAQLNREQGHRLYIPTGYYNLMDHEEPRTEGWDLADAILREE